MFCPQDLLLIDKQAPQRREGLRWIPGRSGPQRGPIPIAQDSRRLMTNRGQLVDKDSPIASACRARAAKVRGCFRP